MSIQVALHHRTTYHYDRAIKLEPQVVRLRPAPHCRTRIESYSMRVTPATHFINWQQDPQANYLARLVFPERTTEFSIDVDLVADLAIINPFDFFLEPHAEQFPFVYDAQQRTELEPYLRSGATPAAVCDYLAAFKRPPMPTVPFLVEVNTRLARDIKYLVRMEAGLQSPEQTLASRSGSCRDSAWLLVIMLRELGLAARFASGYLIQLTADVKSLDGPSGTERDFTDLHAWAEVFLPGAGWVGLDATSGLFAGEGHLPLACAANPTSAAPVTGALEWCEVRFSHEMSVRRIDEKPRATRPMAEQDWHAIDALGHQVDADLVAQDVRLTMGGEPTFVAIDDPDAAEWNTTALGDTKKKLAVVLYHRLREHYGPRGLVHFGQGKWYPGEQLPRWSLNCFWRTDGDPIWLDTTLIADEKSPTTAPASIGEAFLHALARRLGFDTDHVFAAYEDSFYYLWRERRLPSNVDPLDSKLDDPLERARLAHTFDRGLVNAVGYVLPIARDPLTDVWRTGKWYLRADRCFLVPGDSAMGYRLPLDSMPWTRAIDYPHIHPREPAQRVPALVPHAELRVQGMTRSIPHTGEIGVIAPPGAPERKPARQESAAWVVRTALCAELRDGVLHLFMPPLETLEAYLELVAAIEAVATALRQPVRLEGYEPPRDPRLQVFRVTPDPGVIEFNIHPSHNWAELVERTQFVYESARTSRLTTEKFMLDGRHTGTGGGNHVVLGGATPADSPWLRRPDLLRSFVSYWNDHPSLSYLFAGLFIGPTSQAPRIDEARNDSVREIEIAFREMTRQMDAAGTACPPWLVDRLLRNLLIDVTGNTHRAEFCIDKLYSPDSAAGRLGLLELRAFEMPPHPSMSLVQLLLLRALVAWFWREPYAPSRLARWGTTLHDRFMLPHFIWADFQDVIGAVQTAGYALDARWFTAQYEFRFPKYGDIDIRAATNATALAMSLELRAALEPWHVLGEEGTAAGTVRYVDSSVERLQVKVTGRLDERFAVTCNGYLLPLQPTGLAGEYVAGVRYRAWQPATALHPTIPVHAPLTFDIIDRHLERSLAGCQYHVMHPGGRSFETFPINAFEAEGRRLARFSRLAHTPGRVIAKPTATDPEFSCTLDLRQHA